jgi:5-methylcytosine-specific restriction protein A
MKVTESHIKVAYDFARRVHAGELTASAALEQLSGEYGMNQSTASDYLRNFASMRRGDVYKRTLSHAATEYYLRAIHRDYGPDALRVAASALLKHVDYYESLGKGSRSALRDLGQRMMTEAAQVDTLDKVDADLAREVQASRKLADDVRARELLKYSPLPTSRFVSARVFNRNPHVIAAVLQRAQGVCEQCGASAPFRRSATGEPYLEVHHVVQLAHGGEDTVVNARALCPNCHRFEHYGRQPSQNSEQRDA